MRDIAAACEVKAGRPYHPFASKERIVVEVLNTLGRTSRARTPTSKPPLANNPVRRT